MLFVPIGAMRDTRVQGAFVDDKEVEKICEFIRTTNGHANYDEKFIAKLKEYSSQCGNRAKSDDVPISADGEKGDDPKYIDAIRVAIEEKRISTSLLQRKLEVGYSRAAKLIDRMQAEGIVSPPDGAKPRAILITPEEFIDRYVMAEEKSEDNA
jgi:S-DNA-T family DNA segregation ATPase FtsK/SpoIIIE